MDCDQMNPVRDQPPNPRSMNPLCYQFMPEDALLGMGMQQQGPSASIGHMDWSPDTMLGNLTFIEEKIRQVKDVIRAMADRSSATPGDLAAQQQQQLVNADLTCLIVQLISTAGSLLPSLKNSSFLSGTPPAAGTGQAVRFAGESSSSVRNGMIKEGEMGSPDYEELFKGWTNGAMEECIGSAGVITGEDQDAKVDAFGVDGETPPPPPPPESYQVLQLEEDEILAPHTHFCSICGKGFKRDANLRMHMRGHGDEYKSAAALAKPPPSVDAGEEQERRYSCPLAGCKRNRLHKSFLPLKTILCVKNHYKRSHCEKRHTCGRCGTKKFSVMADLKTHEKHCGRNRWLCSCGTSFSRKDKLFAHVALFQGHTPALPPPPTSTATQLADDPATTARASAPSSGHQQEPAGAASFMWGTSSWHGDDEFLDVKEIGGGDDFFSAANSGSIDFGFGHLDEFAVDHSLAMLMPPEQFTNAQESEER
ncbi:hypothetical protein GUJ93_ZPchr0012g18981 [Zizania palustris]|uniref:C2H2-type domain-containing protein n=1 Tax=Zizania palustris TaxID=103762 RepID=A0A8J5WRX3_ZIZPA|nr:hypothetical protein GUJ93_ZPchr0012g18981 [Zizania palustris]KAG8093678.1 hypothetical protein GUJ93_ZPchr0012g18981 [Zizania palustris]KAG8093679.1 hypothetical protein GUJ93_ZPchr0012g18981 [Zizania palustris]